MSLVPGTKLGPYEILAPLGAGGMGEVFRARDTRLGRDVALKILPAAFASDPDRLARFEREAKVLASLNHANIAHVYDVGEHEATGAGEPASRVGFLAMELVDGEDLSARIARGPVPLAEALAIAREIASALDAAHAHGIVHRDLKPANIKLTSDGQVKVLDFGLAKALDPAGGVTQASGGTGTEQGARSTEHEAQRPTMTSPAMTAMGVILGTAAYMAPEQARGRAVDKRADIWAFGCVLYEMLTGKRLFAGEDLTETLASVVKEQPDLGVAPKEVQRLLKRCLEKDPKKRLRDIGDAWDLLDDRAHATAPAPPRAGATAPWVIATAALLVAAVLAAVHFRETAPVQPTTRFPLAWPGASSAVGGARFFVLSPNGRHMAIVDQGALWVRSLDTLDPMRLDRTDAATYPFWSPDSESIGFFAGGQLKRIARTGGSVQVITAAQEGRGGAWSPNGTILFSAAFGYQGLQSVPEAGGTPTAVTALPGSSTSDAHRYPQFLPDGRRFLYLHLTGATDVAGVYLGSLDGTPPVKVLDGMDSAIYSPGPSGRDGYLLTCRYNTLMAQPFDPARGQAAGALFPVVEGVGRGENTGLCAVSASDTGDLVVWAGTSLVAEITWVDRSGAHLARVGQPTEVDAFSLSTDERQVAMAIRSGVNVADVWTTGVTEGTPSKFTFGPQPGWTFPLWSSDGSAIAYATFDLAGQASYELRRRRADMSGNEETLVKTDAIIFLWDWSPDGRFIVYSANSDLWQLPLEGDRKPERLTSTPSDEQYGQVSPDGRWLAYAAGERGEQQIYVQPIPATGALWLVSQNGGTMPRWRGDGRELFYRASDGRLMSVPVVASASDVGGSFQHGTPQLLFGSIPTIGNVQRFTYQPSADGQRFLVAVPTEAGARPMTVVLNWQQAIGR